MIDSWMRVDEWDLSHFVDLSLPPCLSLQKRPTRGNLSAQVPSNSSSYHIRWHEMNCAGSSEYMTVSRHLLVPVSLTRGRISHLVG